MKSKEREILSLFNDITGANLREVTDKYCRFDAIGEGIVAEIKYRNKHYDKTIIEFDKYSFNKEYARIKTCSFYYIVGFNDEVFCFDISEMDINNYNYEWTWKEMPRQTEFGNNKDKTYKYVGYISLDNAAIGFKY